MQVARQYKQTYDEQHTVQSTSIMTRDHSSTDAPPKLYKPPTDFEKSLETTTMSR